MNLEFAAILCQDLGAVYCRCKNFTSFRWLVCHLNLTKLLLATIRIFYAENFDTDNKMNSTEAGLQIEIMGIALGKVTEQSFLTHTIN